VEFVQVSQLDSVKEDIKRQKTNQLVIETVIGRPHVVANKAARYQLDRIREECDIPWKELNKIAKEVVGREFGDCSKLSYSENRKVRGYLKKHKVELGERYRRMKWQG
jgi:hypothetical protein